MIREIVRIDEEKCNGCGDCVPACAEGAIQIIDGKARLIADNLCDGLGACLGHCPMDAIHVEKREADEFDEEAVEEHLSQNQDAAHRQLEGGGCPSAQVSFRKEASTNISSGQSLASELRQWPIQMHLVPPTAPFLEDSDLLLAADCAAFAHGDFHRDFIRGKALLVGCPKLDDSQAYVEKLKAILSQNNIRSLTVVHMEVPCCSGLILLARKAIEESAQDVPLNTVRIGVNGEIK